MKTWNGKLHRFIYTTATHNYFDVVVPMLKSAKNCAGLKPIDTYTAVVIEWWLPRRNADSHNYEKVLFDALQKGGLFKDDRYIMSQTIAVNIDPKNPRVKMAI